MSGAADVDGATVTGAAARKRRAATDAASAASGAAGAAGDGPLAGSKRSRGRTPTTRIARPTGRSVLDHELRDGCWLVWVPRDEAFPDAASSSAAALSAATFDALRDLMEAAPPTVVNVFGKKEVPRKQIVFFDDVDPAAAAIAARDDACKTYAFSGTTHAATSLKETIAANAALKPLETMLDVLRTRVLRHNVSGCARDDDTFWRIVVNLYADGSKCIADHDDGEDGNGPVVASLTLRDPSHPKAATEPPRDFQVKDKREATKHTWSVAPEHGDVLLMCGNGFQKTLKHGVPARKGAAVPRINITARLRRNVPPEAAGAAAAAEAAATDDELAVRCSLLGGVTHAEFNAEIDAVRGAATHAEAVEAFEALEEMVGALPGRCLNWIRDDDFSAWECTGSCQVHGPDICKTSMSESGRCYHCFDALTDKNSGDDPFESLCNDCKKAEDASTVDCWHCGAGTRVGADGTTRECLSAEWSA